MARLRLYDYTASGNCYKVRLLLGQLGLPYERVDVDIFDGGTLTDEFAAINPARATPVLEVDGRYLPESNAILAYLAEGTPLLPGDAFERAQVLRWLLFEQTDVMGTLGGLRFRLVTGRLREDDPEARRRRTGALDALAVLDGHLAREDFLAGGRYSIADIAVYAYAQTAPQVGIDPAEHPAFEAWLRRVEAQPGFFNDLAPYPPNSMAGASRSTYD